MSSEQKATAGAQGARTARGEAPADDDGRRQAFERARRALFARHGFEAEPGRVADRHGRSTYLLSRGGDGRPIVLVHGGLSHAGEWAPLAARIPGRVIVPDRPGCGLSHPIDYRGVDFRRAAADWLLDLLAGLDADRVDLVGNSMGGYFAIAFALAHPGRVGRLVLVGAPAGLDRSLPVFPRLWGNPVTGQLVRRLRIGDAGTLRRRVYPLLVAHPEDVPVELLELDLAARALPGADLGSYTLLRATSTLRGFRRSLMLREELSRLSVPTLFLWGDSDAFAPPSSGRGVVAGMREAAIEVIPDTGHKPHLERPGTVAAAITGFLRKDAEGASLADAARRTAPVGT